MKKLATLLLAVTCSFIAKSQIKTTGINFDESRAVATNSNLRVAAVAADTLSLPFLDDFSTSGPMVDVGLWLNEGHVYVNNNYAVNPPSVNVATFDGVKSDGFPYNFPSAISGSASLRGETDYLISKPINISALDANSNLAFSFYWQKGSYHPNLSPDLQKGDTLKLFFLNKDSIWVKVWPVKEDSLLISKKNAVGVNSFTYRFIPVIDTSFFHEAFQFKFTSYGILDGNFSLWSIDYVYLDSSRSIDNVQDFAFGNQLSPLFNPFSAVPYNQFEIAPLDYLSDEVKSGYANLSSKANFRDFKYIKLTTSSDTGAALINEVEEEAGFPNDSLGPKTVIPIVWNPDKQTIADNILALGETNIAFNYQMKLSGNDQEELLETNDSISQINYLSNYFAYDDGTAEGGISLRKAGYYQLAYEFEMKTPDTLTAIYIYWSRSGYDVRDSRFSIKIWKTIPGVNGGATEEVYVTKPASIAYGEEFGRFSKIDIVPTRIETGMFYVGWEQNINSKPVKIGADFSQDNRTRFYQYLGTKWENPTEDDFYGTPMIRPKFGYGIALGLDDLPVGIDDEKPVVSVLKVDVYPNPANDQVNIKGGIKSYRVYDLTGKIVFEEALDKIKSLVQFSTSDFNSGLYIIEVSNGEFTQTKKFTVFH